MPARVEQTRPERIAGSLSLLVAALALLFCAPPASAAAGEVTLAVVAAEAELAPLGALLEVELSQGGLCLVERAALDSVLQEQEVSAAGLTERETLVRVGRLLQADAFLLLSLEEKRKRRQEKSQPGLLRARLTETTHAVRLLDWYVPWDSKNVEQAAQEVTRELAGPLAKLALPAGEGVPVGILAIQRVMLGEEHEWLCRVLTALLSSRLSKEPQIVVLEREDLKLLLAEDGLEELKGDDLWRSAALLTGELRWSAKDTVELRLRVERPGGDVTVLGPFAFDPAAPLSAVRQAEGGLTEALGCRSARPAWEPEREAERLLREVALLDWHGYDKTAVSLLETALGLQPDNVHCALDLFRRVGGHWIDRGGLYNSVQKAELAARLARLARDRFPGGEPMDDETIELQWALEVYIMGAASTASDRVTELNRPTRKIIAETFAAYNAADASAAGKPRLSDRLRLTHAVMAASTPEEAIANVRGYVKRRLFAPSQGGQEQPLAARCEACMGLLTDLQRGWNFPTHLEGKDRAFSQLFTQFCEELASSSDPLVAFTGSVLCTVRTPEGMWLMHKDSPPERRKYLERALAIFDESLCAADVSPAGAKALRKCVRSLLLRHPDKFEPGERLTGYYTPLIERGDVDGILTWGVPGASSGINRYTGGMLHCHVARLQHQIAEVLRKAPARPDAAKVVEDIERSSLGIYDLLRGYLPHIEGYAKSRGSRMGRPHGELVRELAEVKSVLALLEPPHRSPPKVTMLLRREDSPGPPLPPNRQPEMVELEYCQIGEVLWLAMVAVYPRKDVRASLIGIDLKARRTKAHWETSLKDMYPGGYRLRPELALAPQASYLLVRWVGFVKFPAADQEGKEFFDIPTVVGKDGSLPPVPLQRVAFHNGELWLAMGTDGDVLGTYEPETGKWQAVFTKAKVDGPAAWHVPGKIGQLLSAGQDLLLLVATSKGSELWVLHAGAAAPELVCKLPHFARLVAAPGGPWIQDRSLMARVLLDERRVEVIAHGAHAGSGSRQGPAHWPVAYTPFLAPPTTPGMPDTFGGEPNLKTAAVHGDALWALYGEHQIMVMHRGKTLDEADYMDRRILEGRKVFRFLSTPYGLIAIGQGTVGLVEPGP